MCAGIIAAAVMLEKNRSSQNPSESCLRLLEPVRISLLLQERLRKYQGLRPSEAFLAQGMEAGWWRQLAGSMRSAAKHDSPVALAMRRKPSSLHKKSPCTGTGVCPVTDVGRKRTARMNRWIIPRTHPCLSSQVRGKTDVPLQKCVAQHQTTT